VKPKEGFGPVGRNILIFMRVFPVHKRESQKKWGYGGGKKGGASSCPADGEGLNHQPRGFEY